MYRETSYKQSPLLYRRSYKPGRRQTLTFCPQPLPTVVREGEVKLPPIKGVKE
ncbi:MAG TPA: hypothetical protein VGH19_06970 [Verrucomicrobiae bacterium]